jgi:peptidoglycan/xylan/chitin deacetylase (PgdA/CDA1 family)
MSWQQLPGSVLARAAGSVWSPSGPRARLIILTYHRVLQAPDPLMPGEIDRATFEWHVGLFGRAFTVLPLGEAADRLAKDSLPARALCITFDDGYANNHDTALPILARHGMTATFFVSTGFLDGGLMFNDAVIEAVRQAPAGELNLRDREAGTFPIDGAGSRRAAIEGILNAIKHRDPARRAEDVAVVIERCRARPPRDLMMTSDQVVKLRRAGMEIGAHTVNHPILKSVSADVAEREIGAGRDRLQEMLGEPVNVFAYPNGRPGRDYDASHVSLVRKLGLKAAVSTAPGFASRTSDLLQLPRIGTSGSSPLRLSVYLARTWTEQQAKVA